MKTVKFIIAVILLTVVAQVVHTVGAMLTMKYYLDPNFFPVWSKVMMPCAGPPPPSFMLWALGLGLISWAIFCAVYMILKSGVPGKSGIYKGLLFGLLMFLVGGLSGYFALFLMINLPLGLIAEWGIESLVILLINGAIAALLV